MRRNNMRRKRVCRFCEEHMVYIEFKDAKKLQRFVTDQGKILPRRTSGTCAKHQRMLSTAIKRSRHLAIIPFVSTSAR